jgi:hypothetical protein
LTRLWRGRSGRQNSSVALAVCLVAALTLMKTWTGRADRSVIRVVPAAEVVAAKGVSDVAFGPVAGPVDRPAANLPRISWDTGSLLKAGKATAGLTPLMLW